MTEAPTSLHPDDGAIIRWMDDAMPQAERANMEHHFATCASCQLRGRTIAARTSRLSGLLRATDIPAPATGLRAIVRRRRHGSTVAWKVAATLLLVFGAASAVTPVRAWFTSVAKTILAGFGTTTGEESLEGSVSFVPTSSQVTIRVPSGAGGTLTIEIVGGDRVTAIGGSAGVLVLPEELRFNAERPVGDNYVVRVPLRAETIRVIVGQSEAQTFKPKGVGDRWVVSLDQPSH